jgi:ribosomal protein S18 acetylase RimI-like enzyme
MTTAQIEVQRAQPQHEQPLGATLADAFRDDPVLQWLIPGDGVQRDERLLAFFTSMARSYLRRAKRVYVAGTGEGAALWSPPGPWNLPPGEIARETPSAIKAFGANITRALRVQMQMESLHPKEPTHWYLAYLGTRCDSQGRGIGTAMLREVLADADRTGTPAYLESSNERNLTLYERHGFRVVHDYPALGKGPTIYRMWREPQR